MTRILGMLLILILLLAGLLPATTAQENDPVTLYLPGEPYSETLDPARGIFVNDIDAIVNLFVTLVRSSPTEYGLIEPSLAERWEISEDGLTYTFYLRNDVPWVHYDPNTGEIVPLRMITADDVVYSIQRLCSDWRNGYYAVDVFGPVIAGCERALDGADPAGVAVEALDENTVQITLTEPGSYFLSMATMWTLAPVPQEAVEASGDSWTEIGNLATSGPFVLAEASGDMVYLRNPYLPNGVSGDGNVEQVIVTGDSSALFESGQLARSVEFAYANPDGAGYRVIPFQDSMTYYLGISHDRAPMDNVSLRRAISAAISRDSFIEAWLGDGQPMYHFAPEVLFGGIPGMEVGVGYDLVYARVQMAEAGYPNCEGMPTLLVTSDLAPFLEEQLELLGCTPDQIEVGPGEDTIDPSLFTPAEQRPHLWVSGWGPDFADVDNYMQLLSCGIHNNFRRECSEVDTMIEVAQQEPDPEKRIQLYRDIQEDFFGEGGEFPIVPLGSAVIRFAIQRWFTGPHETNGIVGGERYDFYSVGDAPPYVAQIPTFAEVAIVPDTVDTTPEPSVETPTAEATPVEADSTPAPTATPEPVVVTGDCTVHSIITERVNMREGPGLGQIWVGFLPKGVEHRVAGQAKDRENVTWWQLETGYWVRHDIVGESGNCDGVPVVG